MSRKPTNRASTVGRNLRRYRTQAGMSQEALAEAAGVARASISNLERGSADSPSAAVAEALCGVLKIEVADLYRLERPRVDVVKFASSPHAAAMDPVPTAEELEFLTRESAVIFVGGVATNKALALLLEARRESLRKK